MVRVGSVVRWESDGAILVIFDVENKKTMFETPYVKVYFVDSSTPNKWSYATDHNAYTILVF